MHLQTKWSQQHTDVLLTIRAFIDILPLWSSFYWYKLFADDYQVSDIDLLGSLVTGDDRIDKEKQKGGH